MCGCIKDVCYYRSDISTMIAFGDNLHTIIDVLFFDIIACHMTTYYTIVYHKAWYSLVPRPGMRLGLVQHDHFSNYLVTIDVLFRSHCRLHGNILHNSVSLVQHDYFSNYLVTRIANCTMIITTA